MISSIRNHIQFSVAPIKTRCYGTLAVDIHMKTFNMSLFQKISSEAELNQLLVMCKHPILRIRDLFIFGEKSGSACFFLKKL